MSDAYTLAPTDRDDRRREPSERETNQEKLRRQFEDYASAKVNEINMAREAWAYYYAKQYTSEQLKELKKRGQPAIVFDRIGRKIDGLVGIVRKLRADPKAYPRTLNQQDGADVATQVVRTICDSSRFEDIEAECSRDAAVSGIACSEMLIIKGDHQDPDVRLGYVDPRTFFYDTRSVLHDFSDARFMGTYKWAEADEIEEIAPGSTDKLGAVSDIGIYTAYDTDRDILWTDIRNRYRLVDHWYIEDGMWRWCLHVGNTTLLSGDTPFFSDTGKPLCKFFPYSTFIDMNGDHIGYIRRLKGHRTRSISIAPRPFTS
jgi:hypothetical protein